MLKRRAKASAPADLKAQAAALVKEHPQHQASRSYLITHGLEPLPRGAVTAGAAELKRTYTNYERQPFACRVVEKGPELCKLQLWAGNLGEWLETTVPLSYPLHPDLSTLPPEAQPPDPKVEAVRARERAAHLPKFKRSTPLPEAQPNDGRRVFKGKLGERTYLFDAGDGQRFSEVPEGKTAGEVAKSLKRELIPQDKATPYAYHVFTQAWQESRREARAAK